MHNLSVFKSNDFALQNLHLYTSVKNSIYTCNIVTVNIVTVNIVTVIH